MESNENHTQMAADSASIQLSKFRLNGQGDRLFLAYWAWRDATKKAASTRKVEITAAMESPEGLPMDSFQSMCTERVGLDILEELDEVVIKRLSPLLQQMKLGAYSSSDFLTKLRWALHIDECHAPADSRQTDQRERNIQLFINWYQSMESSLVHITDTAIAKEIEAALKLTDLRMAIGWKTILTDWQAFLIKEPQQKKWATVISYRAKVFCDHEKRRANSMRHQKSDLSRIVVQKVKSKGQRGRPRKAVLEPAVKAPSGFAWSERDAFGKRRDKNT